MLKETLMLTKLQQQGKWSFDKDFLTDVISKGKTKLESNILSKYERQAIRCDIETFERFLVGDYELKNSYNLNIPKKIDKLKDFILIKMAKQYKTLGKEFIRWIINLSEEEIFEESMTSYLQTTEMSIEERIELTIKNYEKNSRKFLVPAKKILLGESIKQIQLVDCDSYCYHDSIINQSYLMINPTEAPCIFNHETEHAIEYSLNYPTNMLYDELGPIYYEMLFNEELYELRGYLEKGDFEFRIDDITTLLEGIYDYFQVLLSFAEKNFNVSTNEFLTTFRTIDIVNPDLLYDYLRDEIASDEIVDDMNYLFSFLKAIELREEKMNLNNKQSETLEPYIKRKSFYFQIPQDGFRPYERYIEEMKQKVRKRR